MRTRPEGPRLAITAPHHTPLSAAALNTTYSVAKTVPDRQQDPRGLPAVTGFQIGGRYDVGKRVSRFKLRINMRHMQAYTPRSIAPGGYFSRAPSKPASAA